MANLGYVRVSKETLDNGPQKEKIGKHDIDKWYEEIGSVSDKKRPELSKMLNELQPDDVVFVNDLSRLARNTKKLLDILTTIRDKKAHIVFCEEGIDDRTKEGQLQLEMIGIVYHLDNEVIYMKQIEGIKKAKADGKYKGGQPKAVDMRLFEQCYSYYEAGEMTKKEFAEKLGVSRPTLNKFLKENGL